MCVYGLSLQLFSFTLYNRYTYQWIVSDTCGAANLPTLVYIYQLSIIYTGYTDFCNRAAPRWIAIAIAQNALQRKVVGSSVAKRAAGISRVRSTIWIAIYYVYFSMGTTLTSKVSNTQSHLTIMKRQKSLFQTKYKKNNRNSKELHIIV